ncbi:class I SAM-dependent methyltransferase [Methylobacterium mesophilicum]
MSEDPSVKFSQIDLDYPITPESRPLSKSIFGERLRAMISEGGPRIEGVIETMRSLRWAEGLALDFVDGSIDPYWRNGWFPPIDGLSLAAILVRQNPAIFLEIGSGNSTKFARKAISANNLRTKIISIDPHPRVDVDQICDKVIREGLEQSDLAIFSDLRAGDVVFMDSSHRSFMNSDVTVFFLEILPRLPSGVIYGLHDIFLPNDYANEWRGRFYNEQYLLASYLLGGADNDSILFPARYAAENLPFRQDLLSLGKDIGLPTFPDDGAGGFWMLRHTRFL